MVAIDAISREELFRYYGDDYNEKQVQKQKVCWSGLMDYLSCCFFYWYVVIVPYTCSLAPALILI